MGEKTASKRNHRDNMELYFLVNNSCRTVLKMKNMLNICWN